LVDQNEANEQEEHVWVIEERRSA